MDILKAIALDLAIFAAICGVLALLHFLGMPEWLLIAAPIYFLVLAEYAKTLK